jgi:hypothetical protein
MELIFGNQHFQAFYELGVILLYYMQTEIHLFQNKELH